MKRFLALLVLGLIATSATAQTTWYARGGFGNATLGGGDPWNDLSYVMSSPLSDGHYTVTVPGLPADTTYEYKIANANYSQQAIPNNGKATSDANGAITFSLWDQTVWNDGWNPGLIIPARRVGISDSHAYGWEIVGSFNGWPGDHFDTNYALTDMGNGLYSGQFAFTQGVKDFKFRGTQDAGNVWNIQLGSDFSNSAGNNSFSVANNGDQIKIELDLPNGKWRATPVNQYGDYNGDGNTDGADYVWWRKNNSGTAAKYTEWRNNYGHTTNLTWIAHSNAAGDTTMVAQGGGIYNADVTGLTPYTDYDYRVVRSDLSSQYPSSELKVRANPSGEVHLHYYELQTPTWPDGWSPTNVSRVGYEDSGTFGWEIAGNWGPSGWTEPPSTLSLSNPSIGFYTGSFSFDTPGTYEFKFRQQGDWSTNIGPDFGNSGGNNTFTVANAGDIWTFELDLPHGKWHAFHPTSGLSAGQVPEPASLALVMIGLAFMGLARRR